MNLPLNINWQQILLHMFNFVLLAGGLYILLYKPIRDFMDKRTRHYLNLGNEAQQKLDEANRIKQEYENKIDIAEMEINSKKEEIVAIANEQAQKELEKAKEQAKRIVNDSKENAIAERNRILDDARKEISDIAAEAADKLVHHEDIDIYDSFLSVAEKENK